MSKSDLSQLQRWDGAEKDIFLEIEYVDVLAHIDRAALEEVYVTPSIDRVDPEPVIRLISIPQDAREVFTRLQD
jgi:hypothetical protein